jgi:predicted negative regulator of RcsB-dependent stress response
MLLLIVVFGVGVFVGYKYPQQVDQAVQSSKNVFNDLKDKISKKSS